MVIQFGKEIDQLRQAGGAGGAGEAGEAGGENITTNN